MTEESPNQWKIDNARLLRGYTLYFQPYSRWSDEWEHDHCTACWAKFAEFDGPEILHEGYATGEDYPKGARYAWICPSCFAELADVLGWKPS